MEEKKMRKKGWLVSLSHKLISMADDPEQQGSNRASLAQQFLKAASFSNHSPGNKKVKIVFSNKSSYCIFWITYDFQKIAYYQSCLRQIYLRTSSVPTEGILDESERLKYSYYIYQSYHPWKIQFCPLIRMVMVQQHQHDNILKFLPVKWNAEKSFYFVLNY